MPPLIEPCARYPPRFSRTLPFSDSEMGSWVWGAQGATVTAYVAPD